MILSRTLLLVAYEKTIRILKSIQGGKLKPRPKKEKKQIAEISRENCKFSFQNFSIP